MLQTTDKQLENLMFLRDVVIPWMRENPERVDFNGFNSACGTYGCLLGWYSVFRYHKVWEDVRRDRDELWDEEEFGITLPLQGDIFGTSRDGTLEERAERVDALIAEKAGALVG